MIVEARHVSYRYPGVDRPAINGVSLAIRPGEMTGIVGPNGSGKTTLLRLLLGVLAPEQGSVEVEGRSITNWERRALARVLGVVVQREEPAFPLKVRQVVELGRYPHLSRLQAMRAGDHAAVARAMQQSDVTHLADRWVSTLSGGEWQRVRIARALAQQPRALVLDEATANLDIRHEMEVFELAATLARDEGIGILMITHHVNLAARFVDRVVLLDAGQAAAEGPPRTALTREALERVFRWPVHTVDWHGVPQVIPLKSSERDRP